MTENRSSLRLCSATEGELKPLRKVVGREMAPLAGTKHPTLFPHERLECGHLVRPRRDYIGETNAAKRRCWQCKAAKAGQAT